MRRLSASSLKEGRALRVLTWQSSDCLEKTAELNTCETQTELIWLVVAWPVFPRSVPPMLMPESVDSASPNSERAAPLRPESREACLPGV